MPQIEYHVGELLEKLQERYGNISNFLATNREFNDRAIYRLFAGRCKKHFKNVPLLKMVCSKLYVNIKDISYPVDSVKRKTKKQKRSEDIENINKDANREMTGIDCDFGLGDIGDK